jgi:hypothetical protein
MQISFDELKQNEGQNVWEFCIVGSGPAGIAVAKRLAEHGRPVLLLEAGDETVTFQSQEAYRGEVHGDPYFDLDVTRLRALGGSSGHWEGWCRELDQHDFRFKPSFPKAYWPIKIQDLKPYLSEASSMLDIEPISSKESFKEENDVRRIFFNRSYPPTRFGEKFQPFLTNNSRVAYALRTVVTRIHPKMALHTRIDIADAAGNRSSIRAKNIVIATGGIENSRILQWSQHLSEGKLVNRKCPIGNFWMEHPHATVGEVFMERSEDDIIFFGLTPQAQQRVGILNANLQVRPTIAYTGTKALVADLLCVAPNLSKEILDLVGKRIWCGARLVGAWEQEPLYENRVALSEQKVDRFGIPRPILYWRKSDQDLQNIRKSVMIFGQYLSISGKGRVRIADWLKSEGPWPENAIMGGHHHMGGTRMAASPDDGVVDRNCKVFGENDIYIAGSSVFPSGGHANPTLTLLQLSLRLADHLLSH